MHNFLAWISLRPIWRKVGGHTWSLFGQNVYILKPSKKDTSEAKLLANPMPTFLAESAAVTPFMATQLGFSPLFWPKVNQSEVSIISLRFISLSAQMRQFDGRGNQARMLGNSSTHTTHTPFHPPPLHTTHTCTFRKGRYRWCSLLILQVNRFTIAANLYPNSRVVALLAEGVWRTIVYTTFYNSSTSRRNPCGIHVIIYSNCRVARLIYAVLMVILLIGICAFYIFFCDVPFVLGFWIYPFLATEWL